MRGLSSFLFGARCELCGSRTREIMCRPPGSEADENSTVCRDCFQRLKSEADARAATKRRARLIRELRGAALDGNLERARAALNEGPLSDCSYLEKDGLAFALFAAVRNRQKEMVQLLLENDAPLHYVLTVRDDNDGHVKDQISTFEAAVKNGDTEIVNLLLRKGYRPSGESIFDASQLDKCKRRAMIETLLTFGADPNCTNDIGRRPLHFAAREGDVELAELLLDHGAKVDADEVRKDNYSSSNTEGWTALHFAAGRPEMAQLLLARGANPNAKDKRSCAPLHAAARDGNEAVVGTLLAAGVEIDVEEVDGTTPLELAARAGHVGAAQLLIRNGAKVSIFAAVWLGELQRVTEMFSKEPSLIRSRDHFGRTLLFLAVEKGNPQMLSLLLANGADVNAKKEGGLQETSLHLAVRHANRQIIELLLENGADVEALDALGKSALYQASDKSNVEMVELLRQYLRE